MLKSDPKPNKKERKEKGKRSTPYINQGKENT